MTDGSVLGNSPGLRYGTCVFVPTADDAVRAVRRSDRIVGWTGDVETRRQIAEDPEFSILESR